MYETENFQMYPTELQTTPTMIYNLHPLPKNSLSSEPLPLGSAEFCQKYFSSSTLLSLSTDKADHIL